MYAEYLTTAGFDVRAYVDADRAFDDGVIVPPDVFVIRFHDFSGAPLGTMLTERLKAHPNTAPVAVLIVSTTIDPVARESVRAAGATAYVLLPCLPQQLATEVRRLLATTRISRAYAIRRRGRLARMIKASQHSARRRTK
jgi:CheY-like chemotaxis protein